VLEEDHWHDGAGVADCEIRGFYRSGETWRDTWIS
jgi:hypothetical protein